MCARSFPARGFRHRVLFVSVALPFPAYPAYPFPLRSPTRSTLSPTQGLHVTILTANLPSARGNATALAAFRAHIDRAESLADPSEVGALRFELLEHKKLSDIPTFNALTVHNRRHEDPKVPAWLAAAALEPVSVVRLRTVFPERSGWREAVPHIEEGALGEVGRLALLIEQTTLHVTADSIDTFRRGWTDLGYNALSEPGVVRCDLLQVSARASRHLRSTCAVSYSAVLVTTGAPLQSTWAIDMMVLMMMRYWCS